MAVRTFVATLYADGVGHAETAKDNTAAISYTAVAADIATLVADGATPTQAHVTTLNTDWGTLKTQIDAKQAEVSANLVVQFDAATFTSYDKLEEAFRKIVRQARATRQVT